MDKKLETFEQNAQVESNEKKQNSHKWKNILTTLIIAALFEFWSPACTTPTGEDIARDKEKIEIISNQLSYLIESRKVLVRKYNELLERSQAEPENFALERSKSQVFDAIKDYNRRIEKLGKKYIKKTKKLDNDVLKSQDGRMNPKEPIDENTYDYLLSITC